jgi:hypothetical protein
MYRLATDWTIESGSNTVEGRDLAHPSRLVMVPTQRGAW